MDIRSVVADRYGQLEKCYGHCDQPATLKFLNTEGTPVITGYSCHQAYLSRIIIYSDSLDLHESLDTIAELVGKDQEVKEDDVRLASRYPWDFEITTATAESDDGRLLDPELPAHEKRRPEPQCLVPLRELSAQSSRMPWAGSRCCARAAALAARQSLEVVALRRLSTAFLVKARP